MLSTGASQQASSLEEISSSMTEIGGQSRGNASSAREANELAKSAVESAETGTVLMSELNGAMERIGKSSGDIEAIIKSKIFHA